MVIRYEVKCKRSRSGGAREISCDASRSSPLRLLPSTLYTNLIQPHATLRTLPTTHTQQSPHPPPCLFTLDLPSLLPQSRVPLQRVDSTTTTKKSMHSRSISMQNLPSLHLTTKLLLPSNQLEQVASLVHCHHSNNNNNNKMTSCTRVTRNHSTPTQTCKEGYKLPLVYVSPDVVCPTLPTLPHPLLRQRRRRVLSTPLPLPSRPPHASNQPLRLGHYLAVSWRETTRVRVTLLVLVRAVAPSSKERRNVLALGEGGTRVRRKGRGRRMSR